jgi:signal transduction histidine kinase
VVHIESSEREAQVTVSDHGVGISPEALPSIFDRFFRAANAADGAEGFGIGLFVARSIIELHGGRIAVTSEPGQGSTFSFTLPYTPLSAEVPTAAASADWSAAG